MGITNFPDFFQRFKIPTGTSTSIGCVFYFNQSRSWAVVKIRWIDSCLYLLCCEHSSFTIHQFTGHTTIKRSATSFIMINMCIGITNHLITWLGMQFNGRLVSHGSCREKQGFWLAKHTCQSFFQRNYCRVFFVNIVPNTG